MGGGLRLLKAFSKVIQFNYVSFEFNYMELCNGVDDYGW